MNYKVLYIWVEGRDDNLFINEIVKPLFAQAYDWVEIIEYAAKRKRYVTQFIKSIKDMKAVYIFMTDMDASPCISQRKQRLQKTFKNIDADKTIVVIQEIEGWYLAGLDEDSSKALGLPLLKHTNDISKEDFNQLIAKKSTSRIDFMLEILKRFSSEVAKQKNHSFKYFIEKYQ